MSSVLCMFCSKPSIQVHKRLVVLRNMSVLLQLVRRISLSTSETCILQELAREPLHPYIYSNCISRRLCFFYWIPCLLLELVWVGYSSIHISVVCARIQYSAYPVSFVILMSKRKGDFGLYLFLNDSNRSEDMRKLVILFGFFGKDFALTLDDTQVNNTVTGHRHRV